MTASRLALLAALAVFGAEAGAGTLQSRNSSIPSRQVPNPERIVRTSRFMAANGDAAQGDKAPAEEESAPELVPLTPAQKCQAAVFKCLDKKVMAFAQTMDIVYDDYTDMLTDVYGGLSAPVFKCAYSKKLQQIYAQSHFGLSNVSPPSGSRAQKVSGNSIDYYNYMKSNALDGASKKISATEISPAVLEMAGIKLKAKGGGPQAVAPDVNYKITAFDGKEKYEEDLAACMSPSVNADVVPCEPKMLNTAGDDWLESAPSVDKSCADYKVFLMNRVSKAKEDARGVIFGLRSTLSRVIEEHNEAVDAREALKK